MESGAAGNICKYCLLVAGEKPMLVMVQQIHMA